MTVQAERFGLRCFLWACAFLMGGGANSGLESVLGKYLAPAAALALIALAVLVGLLL